MSDETIHDTIPGPGVWLHTIAPPVLPPPPPGPVRLVEEEPPEGALWCATQDRRWFLVYEGVPLRPLYPSEALQAARAAGWERPTRAEWEELVQTVIRDLGLAPDFGPETGPDIDSDTGPGPVPPPSSCGLRRASLPARNEPGGRVLPLRPPNKAAGGEK